MITHNKNNDFTGYLGNRMFQAASTIGIAVKHNIGDIAFTHTEYLSIFKNIKLLHTNEFHKYNLVDIPENSFGFQNISLHPDKHYNILGYRQSEKYFSHCKDLIKHTFTFNDGINSECESISFALSKQYPGKKLISVHVRCGDYLNLKSHHTCLMDIGYYSRALEEFDASDSVFIVFSDDQNISMNHLKSIHPNKIFHFSNGMKPSMDMCLMSKMDGHIIANSSFSWWGAWLSGNKTISPSKNKWFGSAYKDMEVNDIIPNEWKQIE